MTKEEITTLEDELQGLRNESKSQRWLDYIPFFRAISNGPNTLEMDMFILQSELIIEILKEINKLKNK